MESGVRGVDVEGLVWDDLGLLPATVAQVVIDRQHVISHRRTESVLMVRSWLFLEYLALSNLEVLSKESFLHCCEGTL